MKAIKTKYLGPTNTKGSRIKATAEGGNSITISYPYELSGEAVYKKAAIALCEKMNWPTDLIGGGINNEYVFVFNQPQKYFINHKSGYTSSVIGNTGEQFILVMIDGDRHKTIAYDGMYGVQERVYGPLMDAGYKYISTPTLYGKMTRKDCAYKYVLSESQAIEAVNNFINEVSQ